MKSYPETSAVLWTKLVDYDAAQSWWRVRQNQTLPEIRQAGEIWAKDYDPILTQHWSDYNLFRMTYGAAMMDMKLPEAYDVQVASIFAKALGGGMGEFLGNYIADDTALGPVPRAHQVPSLQPPFSVTQLLPPSRIVEMGQSVFAYGDSRLGIKYTLTQ